MTPPPLILFSDFGGDWQAYEESLFDIFLNEIARAGLGFRGMPVSCRRQPETHGKWSSFWHLVQEGRIEDDRLPDLRRCERLRWVPHVIRNADAATDIDWWENQRRREQSTLFWYREEYLVVLARRSGYWLLKTAYCTDRRHRCDSLRRERELFWRSRKS